MYSDHCKKSMKPYLTFLLSNPGDPLSLSLAVFTFGTLTRQSLPGPRRVGIWGGETGSQHSSFIE